LRSSSRGGHLWLEFLNNPYGQTSLHLNFCQDPAFSSWAAIHSCEGSTLCCWDIQLLIFWGHLPSEFVFIWSVCKLWFGHLQGLSERMAFSRCLWNSFKYGLDSWILFYIFTVTMTFWYLMVTIKIDGYLNWLFVWLKIG
jgi:hypothetical protein